MAILQMLLWSMELTPLVLMDYRLWIVVLIAVAMIAIPHWKSNQDLETEKPGPTSSSILLFLLVSPALVLIAGLVFWNRWEVPHFVPLIPLSLSQAIVYGLVLVHVAIALYITWYRRPMRVAEGVAVVLSLAWAWSCGAVSTMAVTGNWL
jgi:hypothetical protein